MIAKEFGTDRGTIRYWIEKGPADDGAFLVFLPGLTADHRLFEKQTACFSGRRGCLIWDAPGHRASRPFELSFSLADKARWLKGILERENVRCPVLVGQSMGGYVAQVFMELFPGTAKGFIAIDSSPLQRSFYTAAELWLLKRMESLYRLYPWNALVRSGAKGCAETPYGRDLMKEMMRTYDGDKAYYAKLAGHGYRMVAEAVEADRPYLIDCPARLICGERDRAGSTKRYNRAWHGRTGLPVSWIPGAGHNANTDCPDAVNDIIAAFAEEIEGSWNRKERADT